MASLFSKRYQPNMREKVSPKNPAPEPVEVNDGPVTPCIFMPQPSNFMLAFSPPSFSQPNVVSDADIELLTTSSDGSMERNPHSAPIVLDRVSMFDTLTDSVVCLYLVGLCALLVIANVMTRTYNLTFLVLSILEMGLQVVGMGLEGVGFFFGRAMAKIMDGFQSGYYMD